MAKYQKVKIVQSGARVSRIHRYRMKYYMRQFTSHKGPSSPEPTQRNFYRKFDENSFLKLPIEQIQKLTKPFIVKASTNIEFQYPEKIVLQIRKKTYSSELTIVDYKINEETIYLECLSQQLLQMGKVWDQVREGQGLRLEDFSVSVPQMNLDKNQYKVHPIVKKKINELHAVNLWHYKGETLTKWHYDAHDNFLFQVKGKKVILLHPPNEATSVKRILNQKKSEEFNNHENGTNYLKCNSVFNSDHNHLNERGLAPNYERQKCIKVVLQKGNCIFIPAGWFHKVHSFTNEQFNNVALNFWGDSILATRIDKSQIQANLKQLIFKFSDQIAENQTSDWQEMSEGLKQSYRKAYFYRYLQLVDSF